MADADELADELADAEALVLFDDATLDDALALELDDPPPHATSPRQVTIIMHASAITIFLMTDPFSMNTPTMHIFVHMCKNVYKKRDA